MDVARVSDYEVVQPPPQVTASASFEAAPPPAPVVEVQETRVDNSRDLQRAVEAVNVSLATYSRHLAIRMHGGTGRRMITVYDTTSNEIIREIPPERVLDAHANMLEMAGLLMDTRG